MTPLVARRRQRIAELRAARAAIDRQLAALGAPPLPPPPANRTGSRIYSPREVAAIHDEARRLLAELTTT